MIGSIENAVIHDHTILTILVSSVISLFSGVLITAITVLLTTGMNAKKDKHLHSLHLRQDLYINFLVHQIMFKAEKERNNATPELVRKLEMLQAEMLIKGEVELIRELNRFSALVETIKDEELLIPHVLRVLNIFRKQVNNKPLSERDFRRFNEHEYSTK